MIQTTCCERPIRGPANPANCVFATQVGWQCHKTFRRARAFSALLRSERGSVRPRWRNAGHLAELSQPARALRSGPLTVAVLLRITESFGVRNILRPLTRTPIWRRRTARGGHDAICTSSRHAQSPRIANGPPGLASRLVNLLAAKPDQPPPAAGCLPRKERFSWQRQRVDHDPHEESARLLFYSGQKLFARAGHAAED